ncbi:MAG: TGS domain-containing protein [Dehalococcoidia bacterium]|nr:TGS domain-containing protein [Dehalococcoidia bacterium]
MPANLPPQYYEAEKRLREAKTPEEKIEHLEEMIGIMPKHKGTDHLKADLRRKIAKFSEMSGKKAGGTRASLTIPKEGAAQIAIIGLPNAGKSQLVAKVTKATPTVADYPFTTTVATPGMMEHENVQIQLIDTPPLVVSSSVFWFSPILKRADVLLILIDLSTDPLGQMEAIISLLDGMRITLDKNRTQDENGRELVYKETIIVGNKIDLDPDGRNLKDLKEMYGERFPVVGIAAKAGTGIEEMKRAIYRLLDVIRIYTKRPGGKADMTEPVVLPRGSTLEDAAMEIHKDLLARLKFARIWGSGKHDGVMVGRDHILEEGDIIELHVPK